MTEVVFVHGALVRDGEWWWGPTARLLLRSPGVASRSIELPSCGEAPMPGDVSGLAADAMALRAVLDEVGDAVVVAHSYGGTVVAEVGRHPAMRRLVLVSSYLPAVGSSQAGIMQDEADPVQVAPSADGTLSLQGYDAASFGARFLQDSDAPVQQGGWDRVTAQAASALLTATTQAGWQGIDSTYLVCTGDRSTSVALQRSHAAGHPQRRPADRPSPVRRAPRARRPAAAASARRALKPRLQPAQDLSSRAAASRCGSGISGASPSCDLAGSAAPTDAG